MAPEQPETDQFLAFIERKIAVLQALADSYRAAQAIGALGSPILDEIPRRQRMVKNYASNVETS